MNLLIQVKVFDLAGYVSWRGSSLLADCCACLCGCVTALARIRIQKGASPV